MLLKLSSGFFAKARRGCLILLALATVMMKVYISDVIKFMAIPIYRSGIEVVTMALAALLK